MINSSICIRGKNTLIVGMDLVGRMIILQHGSSWEMTHDLSGYSLIRHNYACWHVMQHTITKSKVTVTVRFFSMNRDDSCLDNITQADEGEETHSNTTQSFYIEEVPKIYHDVMVTKNPMWTRYECSDIIRALLYLHQKKENILVVSMDLSWWMFVPQYGLSQERTHDISGCFPIKQKFACWHVMDVPYNNKIQVYASIL